MEVIRDMKIAIKNPILLNSFFLLIDKIGKLGNFIAVILIAKQYGTFIFGEFSYAFAFTSILGSFSDLGIKNILIKLLVKDDDNRDKNMGASFLLIFISSLFCISISLLHVYFIKESILVNKLVLFFSCAYIFKPFYIIFFHFESKLEVNKIVPLLFANSILFLFLKILFILHKYDLVFFSYLSFLETLLESIILIIIYLKNDNNILHWKIDFSKSKQILYESFPLFVSNVMILIYMRVDQIILKHILHDYESIGNYSLSVKIVEMFYLLPGVFVSTIFPKLVQLFQTDKQKAKVALQKTFNFISGISYVIIVFLMLSANLLITLINKEFYVASNLLRILSVTCIIVALGGLQNSYLNLKNKNSLVLIFSIVGAFSNIAFNFILIPFWGVYGSAVATLLSYLLVVLIIPKYNKNCKTTTKLMWQSLRNASLNTPKI